jgi:kynurenine formamidase
MFQAKQIVDLSLPVTNETPIYPGDPSPDIRTAATVEHDGYNLHRLQLGSHTGTHVDAPYHICPTGRRIDEVNLERFIGTGVVIHVTGKEEQAEIGLKDVEPYLDQLQPGKIALFHTGWSQYAGDEKYFRHPYVAVEAVRAMIDRGIRTFFIDAINIDPTGGTSFPVHEAIAAVNGVIAENLTNFQAITFPDPLICAFPLRIIGCDGSPVRAVAIEY